METDWIRAAGYATSIPRRGGFGKDFGAKKAGRPGRELCFRPDWPAMNHLIRSATRSPICVQETFVMPSVKMSAVR